MAKLTLEQYIKNPMGKNNAVMSAALRETIKKQYDIKFHNVLLRENGKIDYRLYKDTTNNAYYIHIKVPSETCEDFYYDVVMKFFSDETLKENGRHLQKYYVQFYSNDPAFVYTYAHTFMVNDLFVKELLPKMSKEAISNRAVEKNPQDINSYSKILYFGITFMLERGLGNLLTWAGAEAFNLRALLDNVEHADKKISERQEEGKKYSGKKKIKVDNATLRNIKRIGVSSDNAKRLVTTTSKTSKVKRIGASNSTNFVKTTKKR